MNPSAVLSPAARAAVLDAVRWIADENPSAARRFRAELAEAAALIGTRPGIGRPRPALIGPRYRLWSLRSFPYLLVFDPEPRPPQILRVLHMARDLPGVLSDLRG